MSLQEPLERRTRTDNCRREGGPTIFAQVKNGKGMNDIVGLILSAWRSCGAAGTENGTK